MEWVLGKVVELFEWMQFGENILLYDINGGGEWESTQNIGDPKMNKDGDWWLTGICLEKDICLNYVD